MTRVSIIGDLYESLCYDFEFTSAQYGEDAIYYQRMVAYERSFPFDNSFCAICQNYYVDDAMEYDKSLLHCGHLYHEECLNNNQRFQWNNNIHRYSMSQCPQCRAPYHAYSQKFDFDKNYFQTLPGYLKEIYYVGKDTMCMLYWNVIDDEYYEYRKTDLSERPWLLCSQINCIIAIILNMYNLGIKLTCNVLNSHGTQ